MTTRTTILTQCIRSAGEAVRQAIPSNGVVQKEGRANIVTAADLASEKQIMETIWKNFPDDKILSEETESGLTDFLNIDRLWVIDPIDGTNNFRYQRNYSCISIGYVEMGVIKAGAVYDPFRDELFFAEAGNSAYVNDEKMIIGTQTELSKAFVATDNSYDPAGTKKNLQLAMQIDPMPWLMMKGSAVLTMCEVAAGRADLYFHTSLKPWDNASAFLLIQEAGGVVSDFNGNEVSFLSAEMVVGNETLVKQCVKAFEKIEY